MIFLLALTNAAQVTEIYICKPKIFVKLIVVNGDFQFIGNIYGVAQVCQLY